MRHAKFIARTVLVQNNNIEEACRVLNRILGKEEIFDQFRRTRFYEKPFQTRRRFVLRKNRVDPFPGCQ
ncbi:hypothetical protein quinque_010916 [Culex quinquefasciatus]